MLQVHFDAAGLYGGIINGQIKPGEEMDSMYRKMWQTHPEKAQEYDPRSSKFDRRDLELECIPLTSLILALGNPTVDYLSLDIEGAEWPVLQTLDFQKLDIKTISIEMNHVGKFFDGDVTQVHDFLTRNGYVHHATLQIDEIWVKMDLIKDEL